MDGTPSGSVGTTSATIATPGQFQGAVTVLNTHRTNRLFLSYNEFATPEDFSLGGGASITFPDGLAMSLQGLGSGPDTTYTVSEA